MFCALLVGVLTGAPLNYLFGQFALGVSTYVAFRLLADQPLLNPLQAGVAVFYWWFGVGPAASGACAGLVSSPAESHWQQTIGCESLWIVALGLPLYALCARPILSWLETKHLGLKSLCPQGKSYPVSDVLILLACSGAATLLLWFLDASGIQGLEESCYLGGVKTNIWWVGLIALFASLYGLAESSLMVTLVQPTREVGIAGKSLAVLILCFSLLGALTSGSKGAFFVCIFSGCCAYVSLRQRIPWGFLVLMVAAYTFVIHPFVGHVRNAAEQSGIQTAAERKLLFEEMLAQGLVVNASTEDLDISPIFRGVYPLAGEIARRNTLLSGEWDGYTVLWGLEVLVPRALLPSKRTQSIGNFFYKELWASIYSTWQDNEMMNISPSIPFEIVGNYGWAAGVLSFGLLGGAWALFCGWVLTPARLSIHPLSPFLIRMAIGFFESSVGSFLSTLRDLGLLLLVTCISFALTTRKRRNAALAQIN